jgi:hypothetical protein
MRILSIREWIMAIVIAALLGGVSMAWAQRYDCYYRVDPKKGVLIPVTPVEKDKKKK